MLMRHSTKLTILILFALCFPSCFRRSNPQAPPTSTPSPTPVQKTHPAKTGSVTDYANVFQAEEKRRLEALIAELEQDVDAEIAVLTVDSTGEQSLFDFSLAVAREWKLGRNGRGLLLTLAIKDRQWRLQITTALESELPNDLLESLAKPSVELFKQGQFAKGVDQYLTSIGEKLRDKK